MLKVNSHLSGSDVNRGKIELRWWLGNEIADQLAREAADYVEIDRRKVERLEWSRRVHELVITRITRTTLQGLEDAEDGRNKWRKERRDNKTEWRRREHL